MKHHSIEVVEAPGWAAAAGLTGRRFSSSPLQPNSMLKAQLQPQAYHDSLSLCQIGFGEALGRVVADWCKGKQGSSNSGHQQGAPDQGPCGIEPLLLGLSVLKHPLLQLLLQMVLLLLLLLMLLQHHLWLDWCTLVRYSEFAAERLLAVESKGGFFADGGCISCVVRHGDQRCLRTGRGFACSARQCTGCAYLPRCVYSVRQFVAAIVCDSS